MGNELALIEEQLLTADSVENVMVSKASALMTAGFPEHALLELWNASIHNLRRRVETYSIDIFLSTTKSLSGRNNYKKDGDTLAERWAGVDDLLLVEGATQIGVLSKKAGQSLKMIDWMRNHASPSHDSDECVSASDVIGLAMLLKTNLFDLPIPDPAHSPVALLDPLKNNTLTTAQVEMFTTEIKGFSNRDIRTIFGFAMDKITSGENPAYSNIQLLFPTIWEKATEELKSNFGLTYHNFVFNPSSDTSSDHSAADRLYEALLLVDGIKYLPDSSRAIIYRKLAKDLAKAKDTSYGWSLEESASKALKQVGVHVPSIAFEDVYQEILSVWCGNFWGRSNAHIILRDFIFSVPAKQQIEIAKFFLSNDRVRDELYQDRPFNKAIALLSEIKDNLQDDSQKTEIEQIIRQVQSQ